MEKAERIQKLVDRLPAIKITERYSLFCIKLPKIFRILNKEFKKELKQQKYTHPHLETLRTVNAWQWKYAP
jgi:hypothetical protein